jgi:hypothetical protein
MLPGVGDILAKNLIAYCGSAEAVFKEKSRFWQKFRVLVIQQQLK